MFIILIFFVSFLRECFAKNNMTSEAKEIQSIIESQIVHSEKQSLKVYRFKIFKFSDLNSKTINVSDHPA